MGGRRGRLCTSRCVVRQEGRQVALGTTLRCTCCGPLDTCCLCPPAVCAATCRLVSLQNLPPSLRRFLTRSMTQGGPAAGATWPREQAATAANGPLGRANSSVGAAATAGAIVAGSTAGASLAAVAAGATGGAVVADSMATRQAAGAPIARLDTATRAAAVAAGAAAAGAMNAAEARRPGGAGSPSRGGGGVLPGGRRSPLASSPSGAPAGPEALVLQPMLPAARDGAGSSSNSSHRAGGGGGGGGRIS